MKRALLFLLMLCLILNTNSVYAAPISQGADYTISKCEQINEAELRIELTRVLQEFLADKTNVDFEEIVNRQWRALKLDIAVDSAIDDAVNAVNNNATLVNKFKSSWIPGKAEELANEVTELAFNSPTLKNSLNQLSNNVAEEVSSKLEVASAESSFDAINCLQKFINHQYSQTFVDIFGEKLEKLDRISPDEISSVLKPNTVQFINQHKSLIAGSSLLVTTATIRVVNKKIIDTIVNRVLQQVGERVLGRVSTVIIPFAGEIIAGSFLLVDLFKSFDGALPTIQKVLKEPDVKQTLKQEISNTVEQEVRNESAQIAREISIDVYGEWLDFQKDYRDALTLAKDLPEFQAILAKTGNSPQVFSLVGIALNNMGRSQLVSSIQDGTFEQALSLPEVSYKILETTHSFSSLVEWTNLAGNQIKDVVDLELYKHLSPQDLDRPLLREILSLGDASVISKIQLLDVDSIRQLLTVSKQNLVSISADLSATDLQRLAGYLQDLDQLQKNQLVKFLLNDDPGLVKNSEVMAHIVKSRNIESAIDFWESPNGTVPMLLGLLSVLTGAVSWNLFVDKYGFLPLTILLFPVLILAVLLFVFQRRKGSQAQQLTGETNAN